ncbi:Prefoldin [Globomyces pollinis-pini]|nr:Prefoldin [Globomyces pollinis-pini]
MECNQQLQALRVQLQSKQRERKLSELTNQELSQMDKSTPCYRTVGKMFLKEDVTVITGELSTKIANYSADINALEKMALKVDQDSKDAERNLDSLIKKVTGQ